jgi:hypothetical protein
VECGGSWVTGGAAQCHDSGGDAEGTDGCCCLARCSAVSDSHASAADVTRQ